MSKLRLLLVGSLVSSSTLFAISCGDDGGTDAAAEAPLPSDLEQTSNISTCGGFNGAGQGLTLEGALTVDPVAYCDAEVLYWEYDATTKSLELLDSRMELNCCGLHSMTVTEVEDVLVVTERDAPEGDGEGVRCGCMCIFDFGVTVTGIEEEQRALKVVLDVTDGQDGPRTVHEGTINLADGSGQIVINDQVSMWCGDPTQ
jgi:hypothetical protein